MRYMLDTDICIYIANQKPRSVQKKLSKLASGDACLSAITFAELRYGAEKSKRREENFKALDLLGASIPVEPFSESAAKEYGKIRADLERKGQLIGGNDLLIAAHAKAMGLIIVTNNTREFKRVVGLTVELWT